MNEQIFNFFDWEVANKIALWICVRDMKLRSKLA